MSTCLLTSALLRQALPCPAELLCCPQSCVKPPDPFPSWQTSACIYLFHREGGARRGIGGMPCGTTLGPTLVLHSGHVLSTVPSGHMRQSVHTMPLQTEHCTSRWPIYGSRQMEHSGVLMLLSERGSHAPCCVFTLPRLTSEGSYLLALLIRITLSR